MDRFQEMQSFLAVVDAGSFVGAADASGLSKAAVSRHVAELEQRLGVRLLHRTTRRVSLTDDGQRFALRARELLNELDDAEADVSASTVEPGGLLRINAPLTFGILQLAPLWGQFAARYPKLQLDVALNDRFVDLIEEGFDLAVRIGNLPGSQLIGRKLATTRIVLCASPAYLSTHGVPVAPADLQTHQVIAYSYWAASRDSWTLSGPGGETTVRIHPRIRTNNGDTCRAAALEGQGIIAQPDFLVGGDLARGDLLELLPGYRMPELDIHVVYASRKHLPLKTRCMIDFLVAAFRVPPWPRHIAPANEAANPTAKRTRKTRRR